MSKPTPIKQDSVIIGWIWFFKGEWHSECVNTGVTWASDSKKDAESVIHSQYNSWRRVKNLLDILEK